MKKMLPPYSGTDNFVQIEAEIGLIGKEEFSRYTRLLKADLFTEDSAKANIFSFLL